MLVTVLAICLMGLSAALVAVNLRGLASDTAASLRSGARRMSRSGRLASNLAFCLLWLMIFVLSYG
ncbi:hypothetical protein [Roseivivax sediminis]|uniref:Uncharacterized protein n=1 Tax=Roseivivax sediminis TaxID=936889 RepID=A0A1I2AWZ4_9RHOB|nr:hypothetical protein [Roseivivax sediminis]SFE48346.1 hypothetical protein SAMN04515678_11096 [Roseivivax sediminis]